MRGPAAKPASSAAADLPSRHDRRLATAGLMIATAMQAADATIVNIALPQLQRDFGVGLELGAWVLTSYLCATAAVAPLTGWLRRRYGMRRLFTTAVLLFIVTSLMCSLAPSAAAIIVFRILQGAGGGVIHPLAQALLLDLYPKQRHGRMLAIWGAALMIGPILGPPLGGVITDLASWRWVFVINLPIGLFCVWAIRRVRSEPEAPGDAALDAIGILLLIVGVAALQLFLQHGVSQPWRAEIVAEIAIGFAAFTLLGMHASRAGFSVFRPDVFSDVNFAVAAFFNFMLSALLFVAVVFLPLMAQGPLGYPATLAGALIVPRAILLAAMMIGVGHLIGKVDYRILLPTGWVLMASGLAILSMLRPEDSVTAIIVGSTIQSIGAGMLYTPHSTLAFVTLPADRRTDAAGLFSLLRQLGYASGVALMTAVLQLRLHAHLPAAANPQAVALAELSAYRDCFGIMAVACLAVLPGIFLFRPPPLRDRQILPVD
jgi:DHA2 family multidrug resistance protein